MRGCSRKPGRFPGLQGAAEYDRLPVRGQCAFLSMVPLLNPYQLVSISPHASIVAPLLVIIADLHSALASISQWRHDCC